jgi:outer membrane protein OmpA-like peptidoglycan-associated protein
MKAHSFCIRLVTVVAIFVFLILQGCAPKTTIVLLPDPDGKVGHVTVKNDGGEVDINQARQATVVKGKQSAPSSPELMSEENIQANFSEVLIALPQQPIHFVLYFKKGSNQLTKESEKQLDDIMQSIEDRQSQNISVFGHTDTAGNEQYNLRLSRKRAAAIGEILIKLGVKSTYISSTSHGENNPLIKTPDNTPEPRNRRVEVVVK